MASPITLDPAFNNDGQGALRVPGYGLPLNYFPEKTVPWANGSMVVDRGHFNYGANDYVPDRLTVREIAMLDTMNKITDKAGWEAKVFDNDIISKWRVESRANPNMSEPAFDWIAKELRDKANFSHENSFVTVLENSSVCVKSDSIIPRHLQQQLKDDLESFMEATEPDWQPDSKEKVRNLVHPSLFPLVYSRSRVLSRGIVGLEDCLESVGRGELTSKNKDTGPPRESRHKNEPSLWSLRFQWLPCEVRFEGGHETDVKITSYINNLHPTKNRSLYHTIEKLIGVSINPWNEILVKGHQGRKPPRIFTYGIDMLDCYHPDWINDINYEGTEIPEDIRTKVLDFMALPDGPRVTLDNDNVTEFANQDWKYLSAKDLKHAIHQKAWRRRRWVLPEPGTLSGGHSYEQWLQGNIIPITKGYSLDDELDTPKHEYYTISLQQDFRHCGLQVIVKIASVELTPENPTYPGGNWHLEGMINEHIVATSIYYYDVQNVTDANLHFRQQAEARHDNWDLRQGYHVPEEEMWGCKMWNEPAVQEIGGIETWNGRFVAFPNTLQHRVGAFGLVDKTRRGYRRFVVLWLVDPHLRVVSTANVPPQRYDWWVEECGGGHSGAAAGAAKEQGDLVEEQEVSARKNMVMADPDKWLMRMEEAKELRLELMKERTDFGRDVEKKFGQYNLCEH